MKRPATVVPALLAMSALFAVASFTVSFAQPATPATPAAPAPVAAGSKAKSEPTAQKATASTPSATHTSTASHTSSSSKTATKPKLDINSASKEEMAKIPAIGDALADKIIAARPYKSSKELVSKGVLTQKEYDKVHTHLTAKQGS